MGILGNITGGLINSTIGKTAGGQSLARLLGAGLPSGGEVGNTIRSSARWTRSGPTDYRVKCVLPPNSSVWSTFFGGSAQSVQSAPSYDFDTTTTSRSSNKLLAPLADAGGVVYPLSPGIIINHVAAYSPLNMPHSNYPHYAYNHRNTKFYCYCRISSTK